MTLQKKSVCPKKQYSKIGFDRKLAIIDEIINGQISVNHAARIYQISRSSINYWIKKLSSFEQNNKYMSKNDENKKLKERIKELEFIKDLQQDIIADFEISTGQDYAKKSLPETLEKEIEKKKKKPFKIKWLYECFGISKQAYYKRIKENKVRQKNSIIIKELIEPIRVEMPRYGGEKLHLDLKDKLTDNNIKMGRDKFLEFLRVNHLLVPRTKRCFITTDSKHTFRKAPNLIKDFVPTRPEQVFVTDITYIRIENDYAYLALVTDLYSKKIMGYKLDDNMRVQLVKGALDMAIRNRTKKNKKVIHHSDRGLQYCCPDYVEFATKRGMIMSNTQNSDPYENAAAERVNGILKYEFGLIRTIPSIKIAQKMLKQAVEIYNSKRRHCSLQMQTPDFAHKYHKHEHKSYSKVKDAA